MDWAFAINRQKQALLHIVAALFVRAGLVDGATVSMLPRYLFNAILLVLRPAESAVRRLIVMAARGLVLAARAPRTAPVIVDLHAGTPRLPAFPLIDTLKHFTFDERPEPSGPMPRISVPGLLEPVFITHQTPSLDDPIDAALLCRRLYALRHALDNLQSQARRLARWRARRDLDLQRPGLKLPRRLSPFRPGWPPGYRKRQCHAVDNVLLDCHSLALYAVKPDTS